MSMFPDPQRPWSAATIQRLNDWLDIVPDDDVGPNDWPSAMSDPALIDLALLTYDRSDAQDDDRALLAELLFSTFEFCSLELSGNPQWRGTLDRVERDFDLHQPALLRWAKPDDGNPWMISSALATILAHHSSGQ
jgi:hypothetical protein